MCYGRDLARGTIVNIGEVSGSLPRNRSGTGTQLTMRTFIGGVAQGGQQSFLEASRRVLLRLKTLTH